MEITKREIIASIAIAAVMLMIGFFISGKITDHQNDKNAEYQKAVHIESSELFQYGMDTNVGNAFVYGDLQAVDTVTFDEIGGEYLYVEKVKERYTPHTRIVTYTTGSGKNRKTHTRTETYWTWDVVGSEERKSEKVNFCGIVFPVTKVEVPAPEFIDMIKESSHIRYKYYGTSVKHTGTIYTTLSDGTISDQSRFFEDDTIEQALDGYTAGVGNSIFWIAWGIAICICIWGFCYFDNWWLEDQGE